MLAVLALFAQFACGPASAGLPPDAIAVDGRKCSSCHGQDGRGNVKMEMGLKLAPGTLDLARAAAASIPSETIETIVRKGKGKMPGFEKKLTPDELADAMKFVASVRAKGKPAAK